VSEKAKGFTHDSSDNVSVDWYTPAWVFERMGLIFDLDPCAPLGGVSWIPAQQTYSLPQDGLSLPWFGRVWCNPPYGKHTSSWLEKMNIHKNGVSLIFARTDTKWFHDFVIYADAILFLKGRISFVDGLGKTGGSGAGAGSMLVAWGAENRAALERMADLGFLVFPVKREYDL
jgi:hypothetical protein